MSEPGIGRFLVAMSVQGVVFITLLFVIELQCIRTLRRLLGALCRRRQKVTWGGVEASRETDTKQHVCSRDLEKFCR